MKINETEIPKEIVSVQSNTDVKQQGRKSYKLHGACLQARSITEGCQAGFGLAQAEEQSPPKSTHLWRGDGFKPATCPASALCSQCSQLPLCSRQFLSEFGAPQAVPPCPGAVSALSAVSQELQGRAVKSTESTKSTEQPQALRLPLHPNIFDASSWTRNAVDLCSVKIDVSFHARPSTKLSLKLRATWKKKITAAKGRGMQEGFCSWKRSAWLKDCPKNQLHFHRVCFGFRLMSAAPKPPGLLFHTSRVADGKPRCQGQNWESERLWNRNVL